MKIKLKVPARQLQVARDPELAHTKVDTSVVEEVTKSAMDPERPYSLWTRWRDAKERGAMGEVYELTAEGSPARARCGDEAPFGETYRRRAKPMPGMQPLEFLRMRLESNDAAQLLFIANYGSRERRHFHVELWNIVRLDGAWRIWSFADREIAQAVKPSTIQFADFDAPVWPAAYLDLHDDRLAKERAWVKEWYELAATKKAAREAATIET